MSAIDILWLFFMLTAIQPVIKQHLLEASRRRLIARIEKERNSRVILLVHRQETMSFLGFPVFRFIDIHDSEEVVRAIQMTDPDVPLDIVLHTPGGLVLASLQIARAICKHQAKVTVHVPHYAMSGGTLIALAADEIVMSPHAVLGPVDPQIGQCPAASLLRVLRDKPIEEIEDKTLIQIDQAEKALVQLFDAAKGLLLENAYEPQKAEAMAKLLSEGTWTHDFPISVGKAQEIGLRADSNIPHEMVELMNLFPQPVRHQPSVEYLPEPRRSGQSKG